MSLSSIVERAGIRIELGEAAAIKLGAIFRSAGAAIPEHAAEVGGILWGRSPAADPPVLRIEQIEIIPIEYRYGPQFRLSPRDRQAFIAAIKHAGDDSLRPLGLFRSHTRGSPELTEDDLSLANSIVGDNLECILLIHASPHEPHKLRLFRKSGLNGWSEIPEFQLARAETPAAPPHRLVSTAPRSKRRLSLAHVVAAGILLWLVAVALYDGISRRPPGPDPTLGLRVQSMGGALHLAWSPDLALIPKGARATLEIRDGSTVRRIPINPLELRSGSLIYMATGRDVTFRLEVVAEDSPPVVEIVRFLNSPQPKVLSRTPPTTPVPEPEPDSDTELGPEPAGEPQQVAEDIPRYPTPRLFRPPENRRLNMPPSTQTALPPPNIQNTAVLPANVASALLPQIAIAPPPQAAAPIRYVSALPIQRSAPAVPRNIRMLLNDDVLVDVRVKIDSEGNVTEALPVGNQSAAGKILGPYSVQAALLWKFKPAEVNGKPVPTEMTLQFNFARLDR